MEKVIRIYFFLGKQHKTLEVVEIETEREREIFVPRNGGFNDKW
jgi:hypothetical protein